MKTYGEEREAWLKSLKVGDKVVVGGRYPANDYVDRVSKITPSRIITLRGDLARAREGTKPRTFDKNGYERGVERGRGGWGSVRDSLEPCTEERVREILKGRWINKLSNMSTSTLSRMDYETLRVAHDALFPAETKETKVAEVKADEDEDR